MIDHVWSGLLTAAAMLTLAGCLAALSFRYLHVLSPRLRQWICIGVLVQGLMLFRSPVELAILPEPSPPALTAVEMNGGSEPWMWLDSTQQRRSSGSIHADASVTTTGAAATVSLSSMSFTKSAIVSGLLCFWMIGVCGLVSRAVWRYRRLCRLIDGMSEAPSDWQRRWEDLCRQVGRPAPKMVVSQSAGPMLVRRPSGYVLVVPRSFWQTLSDDQRDGVLLHERAHLTRRDVWRHCVVYLAACLHWWNPAAWWCVRRYEEATEWACDEALMQQHPRIAKAFARALVTLIELTQTSSASATPRYRGIGIQSMATPPFTRRIRRLVQPCTSGDSLMKRLVLILLAAALLALSAVQFRLVAAPPEQAAAAGTESEVSESGLRVLSPLLNQRLEELRQRLDANDPQSLKLKALLDREAGRIALAGLMEQLQGQYLEQARAEAIPRFAETYFETDASGKWVVRDEYRQVTATWNDRAEQLGKVVASIGDSLRGIAERLDDQSETDQLAKRLLSDPELGFMLLVQEFNGRSDPVDLYLDKAMAKVLVRRGEKMIVIPTLGDDGERKIAQMEFATQAFQRLRQELPIFAKDIATPDDRHRAFVHALQDEPLAAIMALQMAKEGARSVNAAIDELFGKLEEVTRDTADGLVIEEPKAVEKIDELLDLAGRTSKRAPLIQTKMTRLAASLDSTDPLTRRFDTVLRSGVLAYQVAAEVPYAEFDLGKEIENAISENMESNDAGRLTVKPQAAAELEQRADEWLTACRTIRRYLRRVDGFRDQWADRDLAASLDGPGRMLLLAEIKRHAETLSTDPMQLLRDRFFTVDDVAGTLTVRDDRSAWVDELAERADRLQRELSKDDF